IDGSGAYPLTKGVVAVCRRRRKPIIGSGAPGTERLHIITVGTWLVPPGVGLKSALVIGDRFEILRRSTPNGSLSPKQIIPSGVIARRLRAQLPWAVGGDCERDWGNLRVVRRDRQRC